MKKSTAVLKQLNNVRPLLCFEQSFKSLVSTTPKRFLCSHEKFLSEIEDFTVSIDENKKTTMYFSSNAHCFLTIAFNSPRFTANARWKRIDRKGLLQFNFYPLPNHKKESKKQEILEILSSKSVSKKSNNEIISTSLDIKAMGDLLSCLSSNGRRQVFRHSMDLCSHETEKEMVISATKDESLIFSLDMKNATEGKVEEASIPKTPSRYEVVTKEGGAQVFKLLLKETISQLSGWDIGMRAKSRNDFELALKK